MIQSKYTYVHLSYMKYLPQEWKCREDDSTFTANKCQGVHEYSPTNNKNSL